MWAQEGAPAQLPCSPTIPLQDVSLLRTAGVTWHHLPDRYAPRTWATEPPNPTAMAPRLITQGPSQPPVSCPELSIPQNPVARSPPLPFLGRLLPSHLHPFYARLSKRGWRWPHPRGDEDGDGQRSRDLLGGFPHPRSGAGLHLAPGFFPLEFLSPVPLSRPVARRLPRPACALRRPPPRARGRAATWC